jgi:hypothetical protein
MSNKSINNYITYLINKFLIFKKNTELHEANSILDQDIIILCIPQNLLKPKLNDTLFIKITEFILDNFLCFQINSILSLIKDCQITINNAENIYSQFKKYKNSDSKTQESETTLTLEETLDTSSTFYIDSIDYTSKDLVRCFNNPLYTGNKNDPWRYEYKFSLSVKHKKYIFSLYDYYDDNDNFYEFKNIYWHVASNTNKKEIYKEFINQLNLKLNPIEK